MIRRLRGLKGKSGEVERMLLYFLKYEFSQCAESKTIFNPTFEAIELKM